MISSKPFLDSTDVQDDGPELGQRMDRDGYLYIRGLLPKDVLESLRMQFLSIMCDAGWVKAAAPLEDAIADPSGFCVEPEPNYMQVYARMYKLQAFHSLSQHPQLTGLVERMTGEPLLPHPNIIGRTIFPNRESYTTPPHQDFIPIQGTPDTYTAWFPLNDLPEQMGGLELRAGSHRHGLYNFKPALGAGGTTITDELPGYWVNGVLEQGDVLFFHSYTVHQGVSNASDRLRLSMDCRYQRFGDPISVNVLEPHVRGTATWEEIYAEWPNDDYKYHWKRYDLNVIEYDMSYHEKRDQLAFEMAAQGDETARSALQRIVSRDGNPRKVKKAEELLAALDVATS